MHSTGLILGITFWFLLGTVLSNSSSQCVPPSFGCNTGLCLPSYAQCDGQRDCRDNEDEANCPPCSETAGRFPCERVNMTIADMRCGHTNFLCDGYKHCSNGRDEEQDAQGNPCVKRRSCDDSFACLSTTPGVVGTCIPHTWVCDGERDCVDGGDENRTICTAECLTRGQFQCPITESGGGECISADWRCDGEEDCSDGRDEQDCDELCDLGELKCRGSNSTHCIPQRWQCDGQDDCTEGDDEQNCTNLPEPDRQSIACTNMEFTCQNPGQGHLCVLKLWMCDGDIDCTDASDESRLFAHCDHDLEVQCVGLFKCSEDNICVPRELKCNGIADCSKDTDEMDCPPVEGVCGDGMFRCKSSGSCIVLRQTCDGQTNCLDGSDEHYCHKRDICGSPNPCETGSSEMTICNPLRSPNMVIDGQVAYYDYTCSCVDLGRRYDESSKSCIDDDECSWSQPPCDQLCVNTNGSFMCGCEPGYILSSDGVTCKTADSVHPTLVFASGRDIRQIHVHSTGSHRNYAPLVENRKAVAIDMDVLGRRIFHSDATSRKIYQFNMPEDKSTTAPDVVDMLVSGVQFPDGLAYDWIHNNLYWTDSEFDMINMAEAKLSPLTRVLYRRPATACCSSTRDTADFSCLCIDEPRAIAVHPKKGWLFWSDWGKNPHIIRASLDGEKMELINHNTASRTILKWPNGLTLDIMNGGEERLYWIDAKLYSIYSCSLLDCMADTKLIAFSPTYIQHPHSITVFEHSLYWSDWSLEAICTVNKKTGQNFTTLVGNLPQPMGLKVFHIVSQPRMPNVCQSANCSQFCVSQPWSRSLTSQSYSPPLVAHTCLCAYGFHLHSDDKTCIPLTSGAASSKSSSGTEAFSMSGTIAGVSAAAIVMMGLAIGLASYCVAKKRREDRSKVATNFENPVYRKTTSHHSEDRMELPSNEYQPDQSSMVPLTADQSTAEQNELA